MLGLSPVMNVNISIFSWFVILGLTSNEGIQRHAVILCLNKRLKPLVIVLYTCTVDHKQWNRFCTRWFSLWTTAIHCSWASNLNGCASAPQHFKTSIVAQARSEGVRTWTVNHFYTQWIWCIGFTVWSVTITELSATAKQWYCVVIPPVYWFSAACCAVADNFFSITDIILLITV